MPTLSLQRHPKDKTEEKQKMTELTNLKCEKAKPKAKPYRIADRHGLNLLVTPVGGKLWRWRYRVDGHEKQMTFGQYPEVTLAQARLLHAAARAKLASGIDPMDEHKKAKEQKRIKLAKEEKAAAFTFELLARQWFDWWRSNKKPHYVKQTEARLQSDVIEHIGSKLPTEISRIELVALIQSIDSRGARDVARRMLQVLNQIFDFGCDRGLISINPAAGIKPNRILSQTHETNFAHLPLPEVPELLRKMHDYNGSVLTRIAMELLSLTFVRTSELIGGRWEEIDWAQKQWRIPAERMKMNRPHIVPLATQTFALLTRLHGLTGESGRLFPDANKGTGTISNNTILHALQYMGYKGRMTGHGWRSIASTWLHEHGFDHEQIELQLAHAKQDRVSAAYNFARYLEGRVAMMQAWADALDEMRNKGEHRLQIVA
jgi:integrase